jgi:hypothetical protein
MSDAAEIGGAMGIQIYLQRRRRLLAPVMVLGALSIAALFALALPRAEASGIAQKASLADPMRLLLSPDRVSSQRFLTSYRALSG